jgi:molybdopterin converting factor small subunit
MKVYVPGPLQSYTGYADVVDASGATLGELLAELDRAYPGIRFRMIDEQDGIRQHIKLFVNSVQVSTLSAPLGEGDEVDIICAISGG